MFRKILYSQFVHFFLKKVLSFFYDSKYLSGKFFDKNRMGFWWAIRSIPRSFYLKRQGVNWPVGKNTNILGGGELNFLLLH